MSNPMWISRAVRADEPEHDCRHEEEGHDLWIPMPRCDGCGHRRATLPGFRPIETRRLPVWAWPAELILRWTARRMAKASVAVRLGEEPDESPAATVAGPS